MRLLRRPKRTPTDAWLLVGLGNPGERYSRTPHNAGARTIEALAERFGSKLKASKTRALVAEVNDEGQRLILGRPATYMNESGQAISGMLRYFKLEADRLIVIHDDIDLELGVLRLKSGGGSGGNRGVLDIERSLRTRSFYRVRIGVGRSAHQDPADFLVSPASKITLETLGETESRAGDAALAIVSDGIDAAMNKFN